MDGRFALDKPNAKIAGVCAGIANHFGMDPLGVRLLAVLALFVLGPVTLLAYFITGLIANSR
ncbi:MAG TPA: PspC domain-containing protein [Allosphingosinicella sp.]|uniref:PspC domain-containing protein n=1 Tax=Allosphingosinicella sp. TaxID=2823234 RepID=UPI002EDA62AA